jgi:hypothetical protein
MGSGKIVCAIAVALSLSTSAHGLDALSLQKEFATAKDLELVNRVVDLPPDALAKLDHIPSLMKLRLAEFGAPWSTTDYTPQGTPTGQHLFSAMSDHIVAIVFSTGGRQNRQRLLLAYRNSPEYCLFVLPSLGMSQLTLPAVQQAVRPDRFAGVGSKAVPVCSEQSSDAGFRSGAEGL